jgi:hypothetical protein
MTDKDKKYLYIAIAVVVLAVIAYAVYTSRKNNSSPQSNQQTSNDQASTTPPTPTNGAKLSYGDAIKAYPYRFQFSQCHGTPGIISVKKGAAVMLDNRDKLAHTIKANGQTFRIAGDDYAIVHPATVTKDNVDLTLSNVTCDGGGAATLNVEK